MAVDPVAIEGEEGAISMDVDPVALDATHMQFVVECASFTPPHVQLDETGAQTPMTQVTAPDGTGMPGTYRDTVTFTSNGGHVIICFNGTTRARQRVFAGDYPAWDATNVADRRRDPIQDAAAIAATTGRLG
jgi:hypothetical protein